MIPCGGRSQRSDREFDPELGERDDIHVTLDNQHALLAPYRLAGEVKAVHFAALVKQRCLRRVQILGFCIVQCATAEADDTTPVIVDGEHNAMSKAVVVSTRFLRDETRP